MMTHRILRALAVGILMLGAVRAQESPPVPAPAPEDVPRLGGPEARGPRRDLAYEPPPAPPAILCDEGLVPDPDGLRCVPAPDPGEVPPSESDGETCIALFCEEAVCPPGQRPWSPGSCCCVPE